MFDCLVLTGGGCADLGKQSTFYKLATTKRRDAQIFDKLANRWPPRSERGEKS